MICAMLFSFFLIVDTQMIMDNHKYSIALDDYLTGALSLYLNIMNIFMDILTFGKIVFY